MFLSSSIGSDVHEAVLAHEFVVDHDEVVAPVAVLVGTRTGFFVGVSVFVGASFVVLLPVATVGTAGTTVFVLSPPFPASLVARSRISERLKFRELNCFSTICMRISLSLKNV